MNLTEEQNKIIQTVYDDKEVVKVNAYVGTGKTSTIIEIAKEIKKAYPDSRVLYLVFNANMKIEAKNKFNQAGLDVSCYTAHGFALKYINMTEEPITVINSPYCELYKWLKDKRYPSMFINYNVIYELFTAYQYSLKDLDGFCNSIEANSGFHKDLTNPANSTHLGFFKELYNLLMSKRQMTHGMYLKEFAMHNNHIIKGYDYVFLDEAQDLNPFMLDIIARIDKKKLWVFGDTHQQIYGFNGAINALENFDIEPLPLSISFRLNNESCKIANDLLHIKQRLYKDFRHEKILIKNFHNNTIPQDKNKITILYRSNGQMFFDSVMRILENPAIKVHFLDTVGGNATNNFEDTFAELLYFYSKLLYSINTEEYNKLRNLFKIPKKYKTIDKIISMAKEDNLSLYVYCKINSSTLSLNLQKAFVFFRTYRDNISDILNRVRKSESLVKPEKEIWACTAHRSKGLEWDYVIIADDCWNLNSPEEINLLYVACSRARCKLDYSAVKHLLSSSGKSEQEKEVKKTIEKQYEDDDAHIIELGV